MKTQQKLIHLLNSDENIIEVLKQTNEFLESNAAYATEIDEYIWIFRSLLDLVPETVENFWSGHVFPLTEAEYELESSVQLCKLGFYKQAMASLRTMLELGILSVYWDIEDRSHIDIQNWLRSVEATPFKKEIFNKLKRNINIRKFDEETGFFNQINSLYKELSDYTHTKGAHYSSRKLNPVSNISKFNNKTFLEWLSVTKNVIRTIVALHLLKYSVALQYTPMDEKFGLNGPMGGFLNPFQADRIRGVFDKDTLAVLQKISDDDPEAISLAEWVNSKADIKDEEFKQQIEEHDRAMIKGGGFARWLKNEKTLYNYLKKDSVEYREKQEYIKKMKLWAEDKKLI